MYIVHRIRTFMTAEEVFSNKLDTFTALLQTLVSEKLFQPKNLEIWLEATSEAEGGKLIFSYEIDIGYKPLGIKSLIRSMVKKHREDILKLIVVLEGFFLEHYAYIILYNVPELRRVYGDVELDVYPSPSKGIYSIADLLKDNEKILKKMGQIVEHVGRLQPRPELVVLGIDPDALKDFTKRISFYSPDKKRLVVDIIRTIRFKAESEEDKNMQELLSIFSPYKEDKLARLMLEIKGFESRVKNLAQESDALVSLRKSVHFAGKTIDSGRRFYEKFLSEILVPLAQRLVGEEMLRRYLREIIEKQKTLEFNK